MEIGKAEAVLEVLAVGIGNVRTLDAAGADGIARSLLAPMARSRPLCNESSHLKALQNGHRCQFIRAQDLFDEMYPRLRRIWRGRTDQRVEMMRSDVSLRRAAHSALGVHA